MTRPVSCAFATLCCAFYACASKPAATTPALIAGAMAAQAAGSAAPFQPMPMSAPTAVTSAPAQPAPGPVAGTAAPAPMPMPMPMPAPSATPMQGAGGMPASGGSAGSTQPPSAAGTPAKQPAKMEALDPGVKFEWAQTAPGSGGAKNCRAGTYVGGSTYTCSPVVDGFDSSGFGAEITATLSIQLVESADGEFLQISDGDFSSLTLDTFGMLADLKGMLDCKTLMFTATTQNGSWGLGDPNFGVLPLGTWEAQLVGTLDPATGTLTGTWMVSGSVPFVCMGPWSARLSP